MATIVLSAVGAAAGGAVGGTFLGVSAALAGRAVGATLGQVIDQRLMGTGSEVVEQGRVERFRLTGASEGTPLAQVYGRMRVPGQIIWASNFLERRKTQKSGGGKGGGSAPSVKTYSYSVSLAIALCEGVISHIGRIWADGHELGRGDLSLKVYTGTDTQMPDPKIAAVEGADRAPAYRGVAYVVIEDLELERFGNRVPQFSFEVIRPEQAEAMEDVPSMTQGIRAVAMIPGTGEYTLATEKVYYAEGPGRKSPANVFNRDGVSDFNASLNALETELPNCGSVSLVVSWFGNDLRCDQCSLRPLVEHQDADGDSMKWKVAGQDRLDADLVPRADGNVIYGGTPADASVKQAIRALQERGKEVVFYPFILMTQIAGNGRTDPWTGDPDQPELPWRGRITTSRAPGVPGSPDGTAAAESEVSAFFGSASASDFSIDDGEVVYSGPSDWGFRRFILHYAALCAAAGGVDAFCIGSEMRALTQIRGAADSFPAVAQLRALTDEVRTLLGPGVKIGYAADWSEYFGYTPQDGSGDHFFHLDPLWAHPEIDFIGIDNYMPLSDWRDGEDHADAAQRSIYDLDYLKSNIAGGEGFDWYYANDADAAAQIRTPITDGAYNEPWVFRYKDLVSWWSNPHHNRIGGVRQGGATAWQPRSKPIWFTELGCAAIDKGTNQPNKFLDPKSSESKLPKFSNGARDDLIQMQYLRAMQDYWDTPANNPLSPLYGGRMVDVSRAHVWTWDARPFPWFPGLADVWSDGGNYLRGHWLNGRTGSQLLSVVVREICLSAGLPDPDVSELYGLVRGYAVPQPNGARAALEPLMLAYGFDAVERDGRLVFRNRTGRVDQVLSADDLAVHPEEDADLLGLRAAQSEIAGRVRLNYVSADGGFEVETAETVFPGAEAEAVAQSEVNLVLTAGEARRVVERWLSESRVARDAARFALPPSKLHLGAGDVVQLTQDGVTSRYRMDRSEQMGLQLVEAVRVEAGQYLPGTPIEEEIRVQAAPAVVPPTPVFLDLPLLQAEAVPHAPYIAVAAAPWPGDMAVYSSSTDGNYELNSLVPLPAQFGVTLSPLSVAAPGQLDLGAPLRVKMSSGILSSVSRIEMLNGANAVAIGDGSPGNWEIFQFQQAQLVDEDQYELSLRLRGQLGTDGLIPENWPTGSLLVVLDGALEQISLSASERGLARHYRIGPAALPYDDASYVHLEHSFAGNGLRPYAPVHLTRQTDAAGSHLFRWIRRTRQDGDLWDLADVPLGEATEAYRVRIRDGGGLRRETTVASPSFVYSAAQQAADGVTGTFDFEVAQISDRYGPGLFRKVTIDV